MNEIQHIDYVQVFGNIFRKAIVQMIDKASQKENNTQNTSKADDSSKELFMECLKHAHHCAQRVATFQGRVDILEEIKGYLTSDCTQPYVVYGASGCGKTSVMAKMADMVGAF